LAPSVGLTSSARRTWAKAR